MIELKHHRIVGTDGPRLLISAGVHGDEYEPMLAVNALIARLAPVPLRGTLTLIPIVNRAAFERDNRAAEDGLDLARTCPGRADGSVTEQIAFALSKFIREADFYIDLHTGGTRYHILPLSGYMLHADKTVLDQQRRMCRAFNLPIIWGTDPSLPGRSLSVARDANIPGIYAEHGCGGFFHPACVEDYVQGCLNVMVELGMIDGTQPKSRVEYVVEDSRPNAGFLQLHHPALITGLFEPAVKLGDHVAKGDVLGTLANPLVSEPHVIRSLHTGMVTLLRTFAGVHEGEALAMVLETDLNQRGTA